MSIREIRGRGWAALTPLPATPDFVRGVIPLDGRLINIITIDSVLPIVVAVAALIAFVGRGSENTNQFSLLPMFQMPFLLL